MPFVLRTRFTKTHAYITCQSSTLALRKHPDEPLPVIEIKTFKVELKEDDDREELIRTCLHEFQYDLHRPYTARVSSRRVTRSNWCGSYMTGMTSPPACANCESAIVITQFCLI